MPRNIQESVVVITGASSGIGRASALAFAERGAALVLAARRRESLEQVAEQCKRVGGRAIAVPTDVTDEQQVQALARRAIETFGRLDTWVNNAAVTLFARFEERPHARPPARHALTRRPSRRQQRIHHQRDDAAAAPRRAPGRPPQGVTRPAAEPPQARTRSTT